MIMAPESERAKMKVTVNDHVTLRKVGESVAGDPIYTSDPLPNEPTLTCSEVVERLAAECLRYRYDEGAKLDKFLAIKILTEWRECRVQELEAGLREIITEADQSNGGKGARLPIVLYMKELAEKAIKGGGSHGE
jgi:hypothetical protein